MKNFLVLIVAIFMINMVTNAHDIEIETGVDLEIMDKIAKTCKAELTAMDIAYENFMRNKSRSNEKKIDKARKQFDACADNVPRNHH